MTPKYTEDKRLLGALDYIDEKFIAEVTEDYEIFDYVGKPTRKMRFRIARQYLIYAACLVLLACAMPIVSYIVPQIGELFGGNAGNIGDSETVDLGEFADMSERNLIEHIGEVPDEFKEIVENNLFRRIYSTGDHVFVAVFGSEDDDYIVYDKYGNLVNRINLKDGGADTNRVYRVSDGNYIKVRGYDLHYRSFIGSNTMEEIKTLASVEKFTPDGDTVFEKEFGIRSDLEYFYELDDEYIIAGWSQKWSDIETEYFYIYKLDKSGNIVHQREIAEDVCKMEFVDGELIVYTRQMQKHVRGSKYVYYKQCLNDNLSTSLTVATLEPAADMITSNNNFNSYTYWQIQNFIPDFDAGSVSSVIYYDDFLLIISERSTMWFTSVPMVYSSMPSYTETVYTAYTYDAEIIWRSAVDSTDYERLAEIKKEYEEEQERFKKWKSENE